MNSTGGGGAEDDDGRKDRNRSSCGYLAFGVKALLLFSYSAHLPKLQHTAGYNTYGRVSPFGHISDEPVLVSDRQTGSQRKNQL